LQLAPNFKQAYVYGGNTKKEERKAQHKLLFYTWAKPITVQQNIQIKAPRGVGSITE